SSSNLLTYLDTIYPDSAFPFPRWKRSPFPIISLTSSLTYKWLRIKRNPQIPFRDCGKKLLWCHPAVASILSILKQHHLPQNLNYSVNPEHQKVLRSLLCDLVELVWVRAISGAHI
ncbi:hypothetical protein L9F63_021337, partial [Diploptera punctata]